MGFAHFTKRKNIFELAEKQQIFKKKEASFDDVRSSLLTFAFLKHPHGFDFLQLRDELKEVPGLQQNATPQKPKRKGIGGILNAAKEVFSRDTKPLQRSHEDPKIDR